MTVTPPAADLEARLSRARGAAASAGVDALLISPGPDLRYLTGYDAKALERLTCLVLPVEGTPTLVVPALEHPAAEASSASDLGLDLVPWQETEDAYALVAKLLPGVNRVAVDDHMWAEKVLAFRVALPGAEQSLAGEILRELRMRKSAAEVEALRAAGAAIDRVHARIAEWLRPGRTESQVGRDIYDAILAEGHVQVDFVIVGSGPNSASPHHELSDRVIERGDPVVVDIGGTTQAGYCSDETRTYIAGGEAPEEFRDYYDVLQRAQAAACAHVRPGVTAESVDVVARDIITAAGYGPAFIHRTGHGIGMQGHEDPYIVAGNTVVLEPGMAFSVEPGIYLERRHGARIEDIVVVTDDGYDSLNLRPRELEVIDT
ncbi:Xaa-Pro peptidase family protein [Actinopolymorpha sp. B9G3]|uniref:M24 family metallopeptidase n=1 Tax=Actinopolymorpha sp. B9G3 TaxID=3158970 RepID=UPI0032D8D2F9